MSVAAEPAIPTREIAKMKQPRRIVIRTAVVAAVVATSVAAQTTGALPSLDFVLAMLAAVPPPPDDPLLDASGNAVLDPTGKPMSDPNENFHVVKPIRFDPAGTDLVQSTWLSGTGCPHQAAVAFYPSTSPNGTFSDPACATTADPKDRHNQGLLLAKTGPTANNAAAIAELKKVRGITLTELGYDIRKAGDTSASPLGSHCGGGAPRFNVQMADGTVAFVGCNSALPIMQTPGTGWLRLRWTTNLPPGVVNRILIVFDEGQDASGGPDQFGAAFLDNVDVNGMLVGQGPVDPD
jgi:hypothetical protein